MQKKKTKQEIHLRSSRFHLCFFLNLPSPPSWKIYPRLIQGIPIFANLFTYQGIMSMVKLTSWGMYSLLRVIRHCLLFLANIQELSDSQWLSSQAGQYLGALSCSSWAAPGTGRLCPGQGIIKHLFLLSQQ